MNLNIISELESLENASLSEIGNLGGYFTFSLILESETDIPKWEYFFNGLKEAIKGASLRVYKNVVKIKIPSDKESLSALETELSKKKYLITEPENEHLTIIAKVTNLCNLNCEYCYDRPFREKLGHNGIIDISKLDHLISMGTRQAKEIQIIFHGGEPSLAGTDFYRRFISEILPKYPYCKIKLSMQTNATLLDDDWFTMFDEYNKTHEGTFEVGTSYNALAEDLRFNDGEGADKISKIVLRNMEKIRDYGYLGGMGAIDVVTKQNHSHMKDMYEFYKKRNLRASFNMVNEAGSAIGKDMVVRTKKEREEYLKNTIDYFTYWLNDPDDNVYADRYASSFIENLLKVSPICEYGSDCLGNWVGINSNGDLYPCDRALPNKYRLGNAKEFSELDEVFNSENFKRIRLERNKKFENYCSDCRFFPFCHMNCPMKDIDANGSASKPNTAECDVLKLSVEAAYKALFNTDIDSCNLIARTFLIKNSCVLPSEVPKLLKYLGLENEYKDYDFSPENAHLFSKEYELFRLFNNAEDCVTDKEHSMSTSDRDIYLEDNRFEVIKEGLRKRAENIVSEIKENEK